MKNSKKPAPAVAKSVSAAKPATVPAAKPATIARVSFPDDAKITVIASANPKRPGTKAHSKWGFYSKAKTVGAFVAAMVAAKYPRRRAMSALRWDSGHGFIKIG